MANRKIYPEEFKKDAVRLFMSRGERTAQAVADGLGVRANQLYRWHRKYGPELSDASTPQQHDVDVEALRRRVRRLEQENSILKKAAAFFAKESL